MELAAGDAGTRIVRRKTRSTWKRVKKHKLVYLLALPALVSFAVFAYVPMIGVFMAFQNYQIDRGFLGVFTSPGVGFDHFKTLFDSFYFYDVFKNTVLISLYKIVFTFPAPVIFALLLNELKGVFFKRFVQTVTYLPHFLSAVVITGLTVSLLSPAYGLINAFLSLTGHEPIHFLASTKFFRSIIVGIDMWKGTGWNAIIYLAAIASIDPQLYDSAKVDGAGRLKQIWHITLPEISEIIILLFILRLGNVLNAGFEQIILLYSPPVYSVGDIIDTYVYREGLVNADYGYSTAVGLFKSVIGLVLIVGANAIAKRLGKQGIW